MAHARNRLGFEVERIALRAPALRPDAPPLRFAHLSDLHIRVLRRRHERLVEIVNEERPDFLCVTGDIISGSPDTWELCEQLFSRFDCPGGIFACSGNWEIKSGLRHSALAEAMAGWGIELLLNESRTVETGAGRVLLAGVDDIALGWPNFREALADGQEARFTILLSHAPLAARFLSKEDGVNLVLSGHTHGGQMRIPGLWRLALPRGHGGFGAGLYAMDWGHLYVSRGFGAALIPLRLRCPAEVAFFEVRPA
ncbi:MAG: metallophosphoesterase [Planctomycetota bacterium]|jgi:predicted MPP superfamily phosphohydrolase